MFHCNNVGMYMDSVHTLKTNKWQRFTSHTGKQSHIHIYVHVHPLHVSLWELLSEGSITIFSGVLDMEWFSSPDSWSDDTSSPLSSVWVHFSYCSIVYKQREGGGREGREGGGDGKIE